MAAIGFTSTEITSRVTTASESYVDVTGATISNTNLTTGDKYLLMVYAQFDYSVSNSHFDVQVIHGSTAFADSNANLDQLDTVIYPWWTVWTAVSGEDIDLQYRCNASSKTLGCDNVVMIAINLSDLTENTDWYHSVDSTSTTLVSGTWSTSNNASVTFTPAEASDWLVISKSRHDIATTGTQYMSRINSSGDVTDTAPLSSVEGENSSNFYINTLHRVFALTAVSNTFTEQSQTDSNPFGSTRETSEIIAINLEVFDAHDSDWTEAEVTLSSTDFATEVASVTLSPSTATSIVSIGMFAHDTAAAGVYGKGRIQVDGTDYPATQTSDAYQLNNSLDGTDEFPFNFLSIASVSSGARTVDLDASSEAGTTPAEDRSLVSFTMELAGVADTGVTAEPLVGSVEFEGNVPSLYAAVDVAVAPLVGTVTFEGKIPTISSGTTANVAPEIGSFKYLGSVPTVETILVLDVTALIGTVNFEGNVPAMGVSTGVTVNPLTGAVNYTSTIPTVDIEYTAFPTTSVVNFEGNVPSLYVKVPVNVSPLVGSIEFRGNVPNAALGGLILPFTGGINFEGNVPTVSRFVWRSVSGPATSWSNKAKASSTWSEVAQQSSIWTAVPKS